MVGTVVGTFVGTFVGAVVGTVGALVDAVGGDDDECVTLHTYTHTQVSDGMHDYA